MFNGFKTYFAALGLFGLALYQFSIGDYITAVETLLAALAVFGIRQAMTRNGK